MARKALLLSGVLASLLYVGTDILAAMLYEGYSYTDQTVSELFAIGSPTRPLVVSLFTVHNVLQIAFGLGVWMSVSRKRSLRITAALLVVLGLVDLVASFFPMHMRGTELSLTDAMHKALTVVIVLVMLPAIGFGAAAFGKRFRLYSIATIVILLVSGAWAGLDAPRIEANLPTPWVGLRERISIYGYMLWVTVLAIGLLRAPDTAAESSDAR
jgi:Protein of unknown function (DUF998)